MQGFSLSLGAAAASVAQRKRQREDVAAAQAALGMDDAGAAAEGQQSGAPGREKRRLVIPLADSRQVPTSSEQQGSTSIHSKQSAAEKELSLEERAAAELIAELEGESSASRRVASIPLPGTPPARELPATKPQEEEDAQKQQQDVLQGDAELKARLFAHARKNLRPGAGAPLLLRAQAGRADGAAQLPEAPDLRSSVYTDVPIGEFGEALLRGMGASDADLAGGTEPHRLAAIKGRTGLGATANPLADMEKAIKSEGRRLRPGQKAGPSVQDVLSKVRSGGYEAASASKPAPAKAGKAGGLAPIRYGALNVGTVVQVDRASHPAHGAVGCIVKSEGVPGLDAVELRVALASLPFLQALPATATWPDIARELGQPAAPAPLTAAIVPEPKVAAALVPPATAAAAQGIVAGAGELLEDHVGSTAPAHAAGTVVLRVSKAYCQALPAVDMTPAQHEQARLCAGQQYSVRQAVQTEATAFLNRLREVVADKVQETLQVSGPAAPAGPADQPAASGQPAAPGQPAARPSDRAAESGQPHVPRGPRTYWLQRGIRVQVVDKRLGRLYRAKGIVQEVTQPGRCTLLLEEGSRRHVENVSQRSLQTVIPKGSSGGRVVAVRGRYKGDVGVVMDKDKRRERLHVHLEEAGKTVALRFDDVCELA